MNVGSSMGFSGNWDTYHSDSDGKDHLQELVFGSHDDNLFKGLEGILIEDRPENIVKSKSFNFKKLAIAAVVVLAVAAAVTAVVAGLIWCPPASLAAIALVAKLSASYGFAAFITMVGCAALSTTLTIGGIVYGVYSPTAKAPDVFPADLADEDIPL